MMNASRKLTINAEADEDDVRTQVVEHGTRTSELTMIQHNNRPRIVRNTTVADCGAPWRELYMGANVEQLHIRDTLARSWHSRQSGIGACARPRVAPRKPWQRR